MFQLKHKTLVLALAPLVLLSASAVHAVTDVSATVTSLGDVKTAVLSIGVAVIAIVVGIKLYKWITRAL